MARRAKFFVVAAVTVSFLLGLLLRSTTDLEEAPEAVARSVPASDPVHTLLPPIRTLVDPSPGLPSEDGVGTAQVSFKRLSGRVVDSNGLPVRDTTVTVKPLWRGVFSGGKAALARFIYQGVTQHDGSFRLDLPADAYSGSHAFCHIAKDQRTYLEGEFVIRDHLVFRLPPEESWHAGGSITVSDRLIDPLKILVCHPARDVGDYHASLLPVAWGSTAEGTGSIKLSGLVRPIMSVAGPLFVFVSSSAGVPVARAVYATPAEFAARLAAGIELPVRKFELVLPPDPEASIIKEACVRFMDRSVFLSDPDWESVRRGSYLQVCLGDGPFMVAARTSDGEQLIASYAGQGNLQWP